MAGASLVSGARDRVDARGCEHRFTVEWLPGAPDLLEVAREHAGEAPLFYFENPEAREAMVGVGVSHAVCTSGPRRFESASAEALGVLARAVDGGCGDAAGSPAPGVDVGPRFVGGFAFSAADHGAAAWREFPSCAMFLPQRLWLRCDQGYWLVTSTACDAGRRWTAHDAGPVAPVDARAGDSEVVDRERWSARVGKVLSMVAEGGVEKVVLSRHRSLAGERAGGTDGDGRREVAGDVADVVGRLRAARPGCHTFWVAPGTTHFFGSSPELLLRCRSSVVETQAVAGTIRRGKSVDEDRRLGTRLIRSAKNLREQRAVTRAIESALRPVAASMSVADMPELLALPEAYHLLTPITARLREPAGALELASILHPTPAVCGAPRDAAYTLLESEEAGRGWYTGGVGWLGPGGDGTFAVALRSALTDGASTTLFAGAGIVEGSDADAEFDETELKMGAIGRQLQAAGGARES